jgi:hypothetical protein
MSSPPRRATDRRSACHDNGDVTDYGILLFPEYRDHGAVQVENQSGSTAWKVNESLQQSVVDAMHLFPKRIGGVEKEATERLRIGKSWQAGQY